MRNRIFLVLILAAILAGGWFVLHQEPTTQRARGAKKNSAPVQVDVAAVRQKAVPYLWHAVGQVEPSHSVAVRPQVTGNLQEVAFEEGQRVQRGQLLFRIDSASYVAAVDQAKAQLAKDQAMLANARWQAERQKNLQGKSYTSALDYENAKSLVAETEAAVALDRAAVQQAEIQLGYCEIRAPIDGYTGALAVKQGNLVEASQATPLVTINQIQPALVRFSAPQSELETVRASQRAGNNLQVRLQTRNGKQLQGDMVFIDNSADSKTGTILLKARFANEDAALWPGTYVELDLISGVQHDARVIPETALQQGQDGPFVYMVENGHVKVQPVVAGRQVSNDVVIEKGLDVGSKVITRVPRRLEEGSAVELRAAK